MAWHPDHKQQSRQKIVSSAARLFAHHGYEQVSIDNIMNEAGLTRGAFYAHFRSKGELYSEAIIAAARTAGKRAQETSDQQRLSLVIEHYLSLQHLDGDTLHCPLAFLVSDIAQRDTDVRDTYTRVFRGLVELVHEPDVGTTTAHRRALQRAVMMIGGVAVARAINDDGLAQELLEACREAALMPDSK